MGIFKPRCRPDGEDGENEVTLNDEAAVAAGFIGSNLNKG